MNKRPIVVTLMGWLFIAVGIIGIVYHAPEIKLPPVVDAELTLGLVVRVLAVVGGIFLLRGASWARWLLVLWLAYHVVLSFFHSMPQLILHSILLVALTYLLFARPAAGYFRKSGV